MIGLLLLLAGSLGLIAVAGLNLRNCMRNGTSSAYGHPISRAERPIAFWISVSCCGLALLLGAAVALGALGGLFAH
jgi:hypothetical protein